jgi:hypothetical protein
MPISEMRGIISGFSQQKLGSSGLWHIEGLPVFGKGKPGIRIQPMHAANMTAILGHVGEHLNFGEYFHHLSLPSLNAVISDFAILYNFNQYWWWIDGCLQWAYGATESGAWKNWHSGESLHSNHIGVVLTLFVS